jgi:hypothetical protein
LSAERWIFVPIAATQQNEDNTKTINSEIPNLIIVLLIQQLTGSIGIAEFTFILISQSMIQK